MSEKVDNSAFLESIWPDICFLAGVTPPDSYPEFLLLVDGENESLATGWKGVTGLAKNFEDNPEHHELFVKILKRFFKPEITINEALVQLVAECVNEDGSVSQPTFQTVLLARKAQAADAFYSKINNYFEPKAESAS